MLRYLLLVSCAIWTQLLYAGNVDDEIKTSTHSQTAANTYIRDVLNIKNQQQAATRDGKNIFITAGFADRLLIKDFPEDMESLKIIAFMQTLYLLHFEKWNTSGKSNSKPDTREYIETMLNDYSFGIEITEKVISQYQKNYTDIHYSLIKNGKILFDCHDLSDGKSTIALNFDEKTLDAVTSLIIKNSKVKPSVLKVFYNENEFAGKRRIRNLALVVSFELPTSN